MRFRRVAVTGGAGYVGSVLVPRLAALGHQVKVIDLFLYGEGTLGGGDAVRVKGDVRDEALLRRELRGMDAVIHLACVSNDPSFELDPALGRSINYDCFPGILRACVEGGVGRFIFASSSSVYGVRDEPEVREDAPCSPLTDYSRFKLLCEQALRDLDPGLEWVVARPSTVCGYAPRMRLDLVVNLLTIHAIVRKRITVFGGAQLRPNIHIDDMAEAYALLLEAPREKVDRQTFNIGYENHSVTRLAEIVRATVGDPEVTVTSEPSADLRSYHVNSERIARVLGFSPRGTIEAAVQGIVAAHRAGKIPDPFGKPEYHNVKLMRQAGLGVKAIYS